jgi:hypothetical protein
MPDHRLQRARTTYQADRVDRAGETPARRCDACGVPATVCILIYRLHGERGDFMTPDGPPLYRCWDHRPEPDERLSRDPDFVIRPSDRDDGR